MQNSDLFKTVNEMADLANKELGQNYLINEEIANKIVKLLDINDKDDVFEIGSGFGSLSNFLLDEPYKTLTLNDIDPRSITFLEDLTKTKRRAYVINKSALKVDLSTYSKIIGNLPYYITNDLLETCLSKSNAKKYVFMVQKEVLNRLTASPNNEEYGPLSVLIHSIGAIKKEFMVNRDNFNPAPHVDSVVFSIISLNIEKIDYYKFLQFLKRVFLHRRKTIYNNLSLYLMDKEKAKNILESLNLSILFRPEQIDADTYLKIYRKTL